MNHAAMTLLGRSLWSETSQPKLAHDPLQGSLETDVAVVGGGITGLTTALLLQREGRQVALLEGDRLGTGATADSSAQVSSVPSLRHAGLVARLGRDRAAAFVAASREALEAMDSLQSLSVIPCGWSRVPAYLFTGSKRDAELLEAEVQAAHALGAPATLEAAIPLPFPVAAAVCYPAQARVHPIDYVLGLASQLTQDGGRIFEGSRVTAYEERRDSVVLATDQGRVKASAAILATHAPLGIHPEALGLAPRRFYMIVLELRRRLPDALYWDTGRPSHFIRTTEAGRQLLLVGGEDHEDTLELDPVERYARLEEYARARFPVDAVVFRWVASYYEPPDGLPSVDRSPLAGNVFIATGYSGTGLVAATLAARALTDLVQGRESLMARLLDATRFASGAVDSTHAAKKE